MQQIGREEKRKQTRNTHLPSDNVLVTVFFNIHIQFGTRRFSSTRSFNWVARRKAAHTNTSKPNIFMNVSATSVLGYLLSCKFS